LNIYIALYIQKAYNDRANNFMAVFYE